MEKSDQHSSLEIPIQEKTIEITGEILGHWMKIGTEEGLTTDTQITCFLVKHYVNCQNKPARSASRCERCHTLLTLACINCGLPQKGAEEKTVRYSAAPSSSEQKIARSISGICSTCKETSTPGSGDSRGCVCSSAADGGLILPGSSSDGQGWVDCRGSREFFFRSNSGVEQNQSGQANAGQESRIRDDDHSPPAVIKLEHIPVSNSSSVREISGKSGQVKDDEAATATSASRNENHDEKLPVHFEQTAHGRPDCSLKVKNNLEVRTEGKTAEKSLRSRNKQNSETSSTVSGSERGVRSEPYKLRKPMHKQLNCRPFACTKCEATFKLKHHLRSHLEKVHDVTKFFPCAICDQVFSTFVCLGEHRQTHKKVNLHSCTECKASFSKAYQLKIHMRKHTGEKPFICFICKTAFSRKYKLKNHMRRHTGEKPYSCDECGSTFAQSQYLKEHMRTHTGEKPYDCAQCGAAFAQYCALKTHLRSHSGEKPYACSVCGKAYKSSYSLERHKQHQHGFVTNNAKQGQSRSHSVERHSMCEECGKIFSNNHNLKKHMIVHSDQKSHICKECGLAFKKASVLKVHSRIHSGEKPFMCTICGKAFIQSFGLTKHMRVHTGERPYVCSTPECGAAFKGRNELRHHERIHSQYKPHVCQFCSAAFIQLSNLRQHVRMHTDERPYVCEICGKAFRRLNQLKNHNLMHSGQRPCICQICGAAFRKSYTLKFHMQKKHAVTDAPVVGQEGKQDPVSFHVAAQVLEGPGHVA